jgi:hypothetical protein
MASGGPVAFTDVPSPPLPAQQHPQGGGQMFSFGGQPYWLDSQGNVHALTLAGTAIPWASPVIVTPVATASGGTGSATVAGYEGSKWANSGTGGPKVITLWGGQTDETITTSGTGTPSVAADTVNFTLGTQGWQCSMAGAGTATFYYNQGTSWTPPPVAAIGMACYIPSAANLTEVEVTIVTSGGGSWSATLYASSVPALASGWNYIRFPSVQSNPAGLQYPVTSVRVIMVSTGATSVTVAQIWAECPPKAQLVVIADGAYYTDFAGGGVYGGTSPGGIAFTGGYSDLKAMGIPVVWAPDTSLVGLNTGSYAPPADRSTWAQLAAVMNDGNGNEMNYHGSSGNATQNMTSAQIIAEVITAIKALQRQGYPNPPIKAAWSQNEATNAAAAQPYMLGYRSPAAASGSPAEAWPPVNMWNIPSQQLDLTVTWATVEAILQATHGICVTYLHGIDINGSTGAFDGTTPAQWGAFLDFIAAGLAGGWLEGVTFQTLMARSGYKYRQTAGPWSYEYYDTTGALQHTKLP